ncbi:hypothetical protein [Dyadobacter sp. CY323]|uniref:hypothetical protein n=1 Tax=Dyadobacter sp. CY323 TaxID=2907302 RepID=UPI001F3E7113|nr:hypothetical protein [Dyadobacter sp. CY323]MCE6987493.1 hypothetical protein [Dyadobacter sp. CY323]
MNIKQKIALKQLAQRVSRGIISEEKGREEFKKITGREPDEQPADDDQEGQELGKFLDALSDRYPPAPKPDPQQATPEAIAALVQNLVETARAQTPKRTRAEKPKAAQ